MKLITLYILSILSLSLIFTIGCEKTENEALHDEIYHHGDTQVFTPENDTNIIIVVHSSKNDNFHTNELIGGMDNE